MILRNASDRKTITSQYTRSIENSLNFHNSSIFYQEDGVIIEAFNILRDKYFYDIMQYAEDIEYDKSEFRQYKFRPKTLSLELYGYSDYWYILLLINGMKSITEFKRRKIKVLNTDGLVYIETILTYHEKEILKNKLDIIKELE